MGEQVVGTDLAGAGQGDPDARPDDELAAFELDRPAQLDGQPLGQGLRLGDAR